MYLESAGNFLPQTKSPIQFRSYYYYSGLLTTCGLYSHWSLNLQFSSHLVVLIPLLFSSVQLLSRVWLFATPWTAAGQSSLSFTNSWSLLKLMSIESVMPTNHLILCHPLLLLPSIFPSISSFPVNQLFTSDGKVLEFQLQHQSFQWTPRTDLL